LKQNETPTVSKSAGEEETPAPDPGKQSNVGKVPPAANVGKEVKVTNTPKP